jgi:putative GTP pyrophosphokinase
LDGKAQAGVEGKIRGFRMEDKTLDKEGCRIEYDKMCPLYDRLAQEVKFVLEHELSKANIKHHSIVHRVKKFDSLWEKSQRKQVTNPFSLKDIVGLRVVSLFMSDLTRVGDAIKTCFDVISEENKIEGRDVASFGYMSLHYDLILKKTYSGPRYDELIGMPCEIQVRTIAMDAWAAAAHYLDYKTDQDIPAELKRSFYALSALFYVADQQFEIFFKSREAVRKKVLESFQVPRPQLDQEINFDLLNAYLARRFPDRREGSPEGLSNLIRDLLRAGYQTVKQIDDTLNTGLNAFLQYEIDNPFDSPLVKGKFARVAVVRITVDIVDKNFDPGSHRKSVIEKYRDLLNGEN